MEPEIEIAKIKNLLYEMMFRLDEITSDLAIFSDNLGKIQDNLSKVQLELAIDKGIKGDDDE